jgi:hypothetical protein
MDSESLMRPSQICYHRGENRIGGMGSLGSAPSHPRQALTRLETHPTDTSIVVLPGEVTVHKLTCLFTSLHSVPVSHAEGRPL